MDKTEILIIEDDMGLNQGLCRALKTEDREIMSCYNLKDATQEIENLNLSLVILDLNLPDGNGLSFLCEIKKKRPVLPVIILTANDTEMDIVDGLEQGADDYITKPFSLAVLRARVNAQLRRKQVNTLEEPLKIDEFSFDFLHQEYFIKNIQVELSKTEQKLLHILIENRGRVVNRNTLIDRIWTDGAEYVDENALSVTVKRLRDKLNAHAYIKTVYGIGYSWVKKDE